MHRSAQATAASLRACTTSPDTSRFPVAARRPATTTANRAWLVQNLRLKRPPQPERAAPHRTGNRDVAMLAMWLTTRTAAALDAYLNGSRTGGFSEDLQKIPFHFASPIGPTSGARRAKSTEHKIAGDSGLRMHMPAGRYARPPHRQNGPGVQVHA